MRCVLAELTSYQATQTLQLLTDTHKLTVVDTKWVITANVDGAVVREGNRSSLHLGLRAMLQYGAMKMPNESDV